MKSGLLFCLALYMVWFVTGYVSVRIKKPDVFCKGLMRELHNDPPAEAIAFAVLLAPGEANACLDLGFMPGDSNEKVDSN